MIKKTPFLFIVLLMVAPPFAQAVNSGRVTIRGVVRAYNGIPVSGVLVAIPLLSLQDTTDSAGGYEMRNVPVGKWLLTAVKPGSIFEEYRNTIEVSPAMPKSFVIHLSQRTYAVDEVVVISGGKDPAEETENRPSHVDVVTRAEFEHRAVTVADVIASTPSASIASTGGLGSFSEVSLRGSYSNQVQVYIDGMLLNEAVGGSVNLGVIPLTNVEKIEVWRSGAPSVFGGDAVGGAINIVTRGADSSDKTVSVGYGSFNTVTANGTAGFTFDSSSILAMLDYASSGNGFRYTSDNGTDQNPEDDYTTSRRNDQYRTSNGLFKYRSLLRNDCVFEASEHALFSKKNQPGTQNVLSSGASLTTGKNLLQSKVTWNPGNADWFETQPSLYHIYSREHYEDRKGHVGWGEQDNVYQTHTLQFSLPLAAKTARYGSVTLTPMVNRESFSPENRLDTTIPLSCDRQHMAVIGDFETHSPGGRMSLTANVRRDRYHSEYDGQPNAFLPESPKPETRYYTNAETGVKLDLVKNAALRWNAGEIWREPSFYELFGDRGGTVPNYSLKPEHVCKWDAGCRIKTPESCSVFRATIEAVYFKNTYRDLIQWYTNNYGFVEPANVGGSYVRGIELVWNTGIVKSVSFSGSWTVQRSRVTSASKVYHLGKKLPNRPERYGSCCLQYSFPGITLFWSIDHKSPYFLDRANQAHKKYPGRTLHDAGVTYQIPRRNIGLRFQVKNITDRRTFDIIGMPKPGISYMVTADYKR